MVGTGYRDMVGQLGFSTYERYEKFLKLEQEVFLGRLVGFNADAAVWEDEPRHAFPSYKPTPHPGSVDHQGSYLVACYPHGQARSSDSPPTKTRLYY